MVFEINYPHGKAKSAWNRRFGLNAYYSGKSWPERKRDADELHMIARSAMRKSGAKPRMFSGPVQVTFRWDDGLDIDNHAVMGKAFLDAMKGLFIPEDNRSWVKRVTHEFWSGGKIQVIVTPWEGP